MLDATPARLHYWEPFLGGGNVFEYMAPNFLFSLGTDVHPDLMAMWQALRKGWDPPEEVTEEEYRSLQHAVPSALRGFAGFGCSFGGKWFGGYARGHCSAASSRRAVLRQLTRMHGGGNLIRFGCASYDELSPPSGAVIYCDPPYAGTTGYGGTRAFDHDALWERCRKWAAAGCTVFASEYACPGDLVWERERDLALNNGGEHRTERLFRF